MYKTLATELNLRVLLRAFPSPARPSLRQVLAVRPLGGRGGRRPAAHLLRAARVHALGGAERVLVSAAREGLRKVSGVAGGMVRN